jgi:hypothetical protein
VGSLSCLGLYFVLLAGRLKIRDELCTKVVPRIYSPRLDDRCLRRADSTLESRNPVL